MIVEEFGGPEVLRPGSLAEPQPEAHEVVVGVEVAAVNRMDVLRRTGNYHAGGGLPAVLGAEGCGVVVAVGSAVHDLRPGDRVFGSGGRPGWYGERVAVPRSRLAPVPDGLDAGTAAALPVAGVTAWYTLTRLAAVGPGDTVVVFAAASGVGYLAVRLAAHLGARVVAVVGSPAKAAAARAAGAADVVDHSREDAPAAVRRLLGDRGADVVLDLVGGPTFGHALTLAAAGGRVIAVANVALAPTTMDTRDFYPRNVSIHGFQLNGLIALGRLDLPAALAATAALAVEGVLVPHVHEVLPLADAAAAHALLTDGDVVGKLLLRVDG
ncbi:quinone oxidoreductase family protein [Virgisporangium aurantiacum]|nr:zinc-binding alcohol dehydrogenase family protein [Virgisporangium aurantiacum]